VFQLVDGLYANCLPAEDTPVKYSTPEFTSSYNALLRLSSLNDSLQDVLATREHFESQIHTMMQENHASHVPEAEARASLVARYVISTKTLLQTSIKRCRDAQESIRTRREAITHGQNEQERAQTALSDARSKLSDDNEILHQVATSIHGQRRRICETLLTIFPIEPTPKPLFFNIRGLPLPNSSHDDPTSAAESSAALGMVAQMVNYLQYYLSVPLPYPVTSYGSRSVIRDDISALSDAQRVFPLYTKGAVRYRFDYAVFLLNKNIESLAESQSLRVADIRHTLPNLKYLLYVCSAGDSNLPARKSGGIRGLLAGQLPAPLPTSTLAPGADRDSVVGATGDEAEDEEAPFVALDPLLKRPPVTALFSDPSRQLSFRTKGMRERPVR
jgi:hypothetical protein